ncbi:MAG: acyl--CoA ligase [Planctomycetes bacterium]|nr:acyl--CoA ligase [Planctomycetota bacterium]
MARAGKKPKSRKTASTSGRKHVSKKPAGKPAKKSSAKKQAKKGTKKPARKPAKKPAGKSASKRAKKMAKKKSSPKTAAKPAGRKAAAAPKKKSASKKSQVTKVRKRGSSKPTAKASKPAAAKPTAPSYVRSGMRSTTDIVRVRARFTEPLRRFSPYENLRDLIQGQAEKYEDRTFLIFEDDGREYSYRTLDTQTTKVANVLHDLGAQKGARVVLLLENSPDFVFAFLGVMKGGFIAVPMNLRLEDERLRFLLEDCGASTVITSAAQWERISPLLGSLPGLASVLVTGKTDKLESVGIEGNHLVEHEGAGAQYRILDFHGCLNAASDELKTTRLGWWDEAQIVYTGHHLDQPRGAILQHRQFMTSARWLAIWLNLDSMQRFMSVLPLFHANAQIVTLFTPLQIGASVVLSREFSVSRVWKAVERYRVTSLSAVPSMLGILTDRELSEAKGARPSTDSSWPAPHESPGTLAQRDDQDARERGLARAHDISSLERVLCGAAPLPTAVQKLFEQVFLVPVIEGYSMAETTCFAMLNPGNGTRKLGSVGVAVGDKVAVQSNEMHPRPLTDDWLPMALPRMNPAVFPTAEVGEPGEICVWGENVLKEYFQRPQVNPEAFAGGWFHTGDIGYQDSEGFFYVLGLRGEEIERDGVRFMPREVDEQLFTHSQVEQAATVAVEASSGSTATTWIVMRKGTFPGGPEDGRLPKDDAQSNEMREEIQAYLSQKLSEKKHPTSIMFARELPSDVTGKTRIFDLKQLAARQNEQSK